MLKRVYAERKMESKRLSKRLWALWSNNAAKWMRHHMMVALKGLSEDDPFTDCYLANWEEAVENYRKILKHRKPYGTSTVYDLWEDPFSGYYFLEKEEGERNISTDKEVKEILALKREAKFKEYAESSIDFDLDYETGNLVGRVIDSAKRGIR